MIPEKIINFIASPDHNAMIENIAQFLGFGWGDERMPRLINFADEIVREKNFNNDLKKIIKKWLIFLDEAQIEAFENYFRGHYQSFLENLWQEAEKEEQEMLAEENKFQELSFEEREQKYLELMKEFLNIESENKPLEQTEAAPEEDISVNKDGVAKNEIFESETLVNLQKSEDLTSIPDVVTTKPDFKKVSLEQDQDKEDSANQPKIELRDDNKVIVFGMLPESQKENEAVQRLKTEENIVSINWKKNEEKKPELPEGTVIIKKKEKKEVINEDELVDLSNL